MSVIDRIELTDEERHRWRFADNDHTRRAFKWVAAQSSERLRACVAFKPDGGFDFAAPSFALLLSEFGAGTNPSWLMARVAEALYERGAIAEREFDRIVDSSL